MTQLLEKEAGRAVRAGAPSESRVRVIVLVAVAAVVVAIALWWVPSLGGASLSPQEIEALRAQALVEHHERVWLTPEAIQDARAQALVDYHERRWQAE
jgi:hypothetical protein